MILFLYTPHPSYIYNYYKANRFPSYVFFQEINEGKELLFEKEGVQGIVQVFKEKRSNSLLLVNGGKTEGVATRVGVQIEGGMTRDWTTQLLTAYLPLEANPGARSFLNIGLGSGTTLRAAMSEAGLREIDCVEINPVIMEAVKGYFYPELFEDRRTEFIVADARNYLFLVPKRYDIIASEPSYPVDQGMSNLFSVEFARLARARLTEKGVFAQWLPGYLLSENDNKVMIRTFGSVFPYTYVWHVLSTNDIILLGSNRALTPPEAVYERIDAREKAKGLWRNYRLWLTPEDVRRMVEKGGVVNTDDRPVLEFVAARNMLGGGK
jgi:spermidine synthase